jgi:DNA-binding NarL/FixJ family response regulator
MNGLEAAQTILDQNSHIRIIMLTSVQKIECIQEAKKIGIRGYLLKNSLPQDIIEAVQIVAQGGCYFKCPSSERVCA